MRRFGLAALQLELAPANNLEIIAAEIAAARRRFPWIDMVLLAELASHGVSLDRAEPLPGPTEERYRALAREHGLWLLPGSLYERDGERIFNTAPVIDPAGTVVARHRKIYPFQPYERGVASGVDCTVFDIPDVGRFGVSTCYDMWFPETTRTLAWKGAEVILHPSLTNTIDRDVEIAIARAAAATNQCYFIDLNCAGVLGFGRSAAFGPGGEALHVAGSGREIIALEIDLDLVTTLRERGWQGLGQPLKSFRDTEVRYPPYAPDAHRGGALAKLGPLERPAGRKLKT
jgi:deaminated glutathione amidase